MSRLDELINELCPDGVEYKKLEDIGTSLTGMSAASNKWADSGNCQFIDYMNAYKHIKIDVLDLPFATVRNIDKQQLVNRIWIVRRHISTKKLPPKQEHRFYPSATTALL